MAFLDSYSGIERIPVGDEYWIEVKTCLSHDEKEGADRFLHKMTASFDDKGKSHAVANPDYGAYSRALVAASIVDWNLDESDGRIWQLSPDSARLRNIGRLPEAVFDRVFERVTALNKEDPAEDRSFRGEAERGDPDGDTGAADVAEVSPGPSLVDESGPACATPRFAAVA